MPDLIRTANTQDIPIIASHIQGLCAHHGDTYVPDQDFLSSQFPPDRSGLTFFLGEQNGHPISFAAIHLWPRLHCNETGINIHLLFVQDPYRGRGYGRKMIQHIAAHARDLGCNSLRVSADLQNEPTQQTYLKMGFKRLNMGGAHFRMDLCGPLSP